MSQGMDTYPKSIGYHSHFQSGRGYTVTEHFTIEAAYRMPNTWFGDTDRAVLLVDQVNSMIPYGGGGSEGLSAGPGVTTLLCMSCEHGIITVDWRVPADVAVTFWDRETVLRRMEDEQGRLFGCRCRPLGRE